MNTPEGWKQALDRAVEHPTVLEIMADCADAIDTENHAQHDPEVFGESYDGLKWTALAADLRARASAIRAEDPDIWPMLAAAPTPPEQPGESVCATCGGLVSDPVIVQPAAQGELTDERIDEIGLGLSDYDDPAYFRCMARAIEREVLANSRKRPEAEVAEIMGAKRALVLAAIAAGVAKVGSTEDVQEQLNADLRSADANFERLVRGGGS